MQSKRNELLCLIFAMTISGCAISGKDVRAPRPECPKPQAPSPSLMTTPNYADRLQGLLFESEPTPTRK